MKKNKFPQLIGNVNGVVSQVWIKLETNKSRTKRISVGITDKRIPVVPALHSTNLLHQPAVLEGYRSIL
jgi:hypothetical protein